MFYWGLAVPLLIAASLSFATAAQVPGAYIFEFASGHVRLSLVF